MQYLSEKKSSDLFIRSLFCPLQMSSPIPRRPAQSGPGERRPPGRGGLRAAPRKLAAAVSQRDASQLLDALVAYLLAKAVSPGRRPFLPQDHCQSLILHHITLQWSEQAERASIQQNKTKSAFSMTLLPALQDKYGVVKKVWKHLLSLPQKNCWWNLRNIQDTCALLHGNFFGVRLKIASRILLQSGDHKTKCLFFTRSQFC